MALSRIQTKPRDAALHGGLANLAAALVVSIASISPALAEDDAAALAKQLANPVAA